MLTTRTVSKTFGAFGSASKMDIFTLHQLASFCQISYKNFTLQQNDRFMVLVLKKGASKREIDSINKKLRDLPVRKKLDTKKYKGVIDLKSDPLAVQKMLRDEWE
jgi:hypothetical protein